MLRINELKLPLHHAPEELPAAIYDRLGVTEAEVLSWTMFRRGNDARKKGAIKLVYTIDVTLADEAAVTARLAGDPHIRPTPDISYNFVTQAPANYSGPRPVIIGAGPCACLLPSFSHRWGSAPSSSNAAQPCGNGRRTHGPCGARAS